MYIIINCANCSKLIMASTANRTKTCPHCGAKMQTVNVKIVAKTESTKDALAIIQHLKQKESNISHPDVFKKFKI